MGGAVNDLLTSAETDTLLDIAAMLQRCNGNNGEEREREVHAHYIRSASANEDGRLSGQLEAAAAYEYSNFRLDDRELQTT